MRGMHGLPGWDITCTSSVSTAFERRVAPNSGAGTAARFNAQCAARTAELDHSISSPCCQHANVLPPRSPKFTLRANRGLELPIHGDGLAVRSYLYVEDVADAYITVLLKGKVGSAAPGWEHPSWERVCGP